MIPAKWAKICARLRGLLKVDTRPHKLTDGATTLPRLVVSLAPPYGFTDERLDEMLEALALLYESGTSTQRTLGNKRGFWLEVLGSPMMNGEDARRDAAANGTEWCRFLATGAFMVFLDWETKRFLQFNAPNADVIKALTTLFRQPRPPHVPPMTIGIKFPWHGLTEPTLTAIDTLLWTDEKGMLATDRLAVLDLGGHCLPEASLRALATLLVAYEVSELRLDHPALKEIQNPLALPSLLECALHNVNHHGPVTIAIDGIKLSASMVEAIAGSLNNQPQRLTRLSLAGSLTAPQHCNGASESWWWLARIMFQVASIGSRDKVSWSEFVTLDLSDNVVSGIAIKCFRQSLFALVMEQAAGNDSLWCRVRPATCAFSVATSLVDSHATELDEAIEYQVHLGQNEQVGDMLRLVEPAGWVSIESIVAFRSGDQHFELRPRFNSLVLTRLKCDPGTTSTSAAVDLLKFARPNLRRLCVTDASPLLPVVVECARLTHLDLCGYYVPELCKICEAKPMKALRTLSVRMCASWHVELLAGFVEAHPALEVIETNRTIASREDPQYAPKCKAFAASHNARELAAHSLTTRTKYALLSVPVIQGLAMPLVHIIWTFAQKRATRRVQWVS